MSSSQPPHGTDNVLKFLRVASSGGKVVKGTTSGKNMEFNAFFCAALASIQLPVLDAADQSRIEIFDLRRNDKVSWAVMRKNLN
jgi:hypothetical protein